MKIAVVCASGRVGTLITKELVNRGHEVTAIIKPNKKMEIAHIDIMYKDLFTLNENDLRNFDVVVDAFGIWDIDKQYLHSDSLLHLCNILKNTPIRLYVVGGAGSLYIDQKLTSQVYQQSDFPEAYLPVAKNMAIALEKLRLIKNVKWTYVSPALIFDSEGKETKNYQINGEVLKMNSRNQSYISYKDYALAFVDIIESKTYLNQRVSVNSK